MRLPYSALLAATLLAASPLHAQTTTPAHTVFLLGNTAQAELPTARLKLLRHAGAANRPLHGGASGRHRGQHRPEQQRRHRPRSGRATRADALIALVKGLPQGKIYFLPGDKDWANSGPAGLKAVRRLEKYIEKQLPGQNAFHPHQRLPRPRSSGRSPAG
jgi:hypothetical protein